MWAFRLGQIVLLDTRDAAGPCEYHCPPNNQDYASKRCKDAHEHNAQALAVESDNLGVAEQVAVDVKGVPKHYDHQHR